MSGDADAVQGEPEETSRGGQAGLGRSRGSPKTLSKRVCFEAGPLQPAGPDIRDQHARTSGGTGPPEPPAELVKEEAGPTASSDDAQEIAEIVEVEEEVASSEESQGIPEIEVGKEISSSGELLDIPGVIEVEEIDLAELLGEQGQDQPGGENAESLFAEGLDHHDRGEFDPAIDCYRRAVALDPSFLDAHNNLGMIYTDKGMLREADVGFFTVDLFQDRGTPPAVGESEGLTESAISLDAGLSTQVTFTGLTSAVAATWQMYAIVDTGESIDESNEGNNVEGPVLVGWGVVVEAIIVTSPNGAEVLEAGESHVIAWTVEGGLTPPFHIEYSVDGGSSWREIVGLTFNAETFTWTVPAVPSTECRVFVSNTAGTVSDISDGTFEIHVTPVEPWLGTGCSLGTRAGAAPGGCAACALIFAALWAAAFRFRGRPAA